LTREENMAEAVKPRAEEEADCMYLVGDYIHPTPHSGRCRVRIYRPDLPEAKPGSAARDEAVVICTELKDNPGMSVTNSAEQIAGEVISFHRLPTPLVWIEHYEDGARGTPEDAATSTW
jgi:hypothetical protein